MKRFLISVLFLFITIVSYSQIKILSIEPDAADLTARINPKQDRNGNDCALLRITTNGIDKEQREKFQFSGDMATQIVELTFPTGEIWIYLSPGKGTLIIKHEDYGNLLYDMPIALEKKTTYRMVMEMATATLTIRAVPNEAKIYIDDKLEGTGFVNKNLSMGMEHTYKVTCDFYYDKIETFKISDNKEIEVKLEPAFGYLSVNTGNIIGADVNIDGVKAGVTPFLSDRLSVGKHRVEVSKEYYVPQMKMIDIGSDETVELDMTLQENFAQPVITTAEGAEIWINNENKGSNYWTGRLAAGDYTIEARKEGCAPTRQYVTLNIGERKTITLEAPRPKNGNLEISCNVSGAAITLNGKPEGQTPKTISNVLVGEYRLSVFKQGYITANKDVTVNDGETTYVNIELFEKATGKEITITSEPVGAEVYVDGTLLGITPLTQTLVFGSHNVKVVKGKQQKEQNINVTETSNTRYSFDVSDNKINGHDYVDLGLPSGLKWATCNVGANSPEEYGNYYAWGETSTKSSYTEYNSKTYSKSMGDIGGDAQYDAARANWGGTWRLPTRAEFEELENKCTWTWTTQGGKNGYKVTGPNGNSIFLPVASCRYGTSLYDAGENGFYWSSTPYGSNTVGAHYLYFYSGDHFTYWSSRDYGLSVRPVSE